MKLSELLTDYVNAAFTGLYVQTHEPDEAEREIAALAKEKKWKVAVWDIAGGLRFPNASHDSPTEVGSGDPLAVLRAVHTLADPEGTALVILHNFHRYLNNPEVVQRTFTQLISGKEQRVFLVLLAALVQVPIELEKLFVILEHPLPDREQLGQIARQVTSDRPEDLPSGEALNRILDAASGLTRYESEGAFALSIARHNAIQAPEVWELKTQTLKKSGLLTLHRGGEGFSNLGGLQAMKDFCLKALTPRSSRLVKPKGVLLLGVPGTGKSYFARALGNEIGRPILILDVGALLGSLVGQSEANLRQALRIVDATGPAVLFVDELEKALAGVGGQGDSGVSTRLFGALLVWLSDHTSDVFFIGTSNDISKLPPEFARAERFDAVFFIDLPTRAEKDAIWRLYRSQFDIEPSDAQPADVNWTGAEIRACCRLASLLDVPLKQSAGNVVPVAVTAAEQVERLRTWASGRCLSAATPGIYTGSETTKSGRRVNRPNDN